MSKSFKSEDDLMHWLRVGGHIKRGDVSGTSYKMGPDNKLIDADGGTYQTPVLNLAKLDKWVKVV